MLTYWLLFLVPAYACITAHNKPRPMTDRLEASWLLAGVALVMLIGLRHQVGGDWRNYESMYQDIVSAPNSTVWNMGGGDPGYVLLNLISGQVGGGVYLVNLMCGALFSWGLVAFCRHQTRPWLALAVAVPYMIIVVGMGYSRQGVALGLVMLGMTQLAKKSIVQFVVCVALAATFHKSAVLLVPLAMLSNPRGRLWACIWVGISAAVLYYLLLARSADNLVVNYIGAQYQSSGAAMRIAMNVLPAALLLVLHKRFVWQPAERNLWVIMAILALASVGWLMVSASSTAVDRLALYLIPLQLYVFSRLPDLLGQGRGLRQWVLAIVMYYGVVLFVWLNYASFSYTWIPYRIWLFI